MLLFQNRAWRHLTYENSTCIHKCTVGLVTSWSSCSMQWGINKVMRHVNVIHSRVNVDLYFVIVLILPLFWHAKMPFLAITSRKHVGQWQSAKEEWSKCWAWLVFCLAFKKIRMVNVSCIIFGWRILNYRKLGELVKLHIYLQHKQKQLKTKEGCLNTIAVRAFLRCLVCFICAVKVKITEYIFKGGLDCGRPTIPSLSLQLWSNRDQHDCKHRKKKS